MTVKMTAERRSGRLLGVQIVGYERSAKRIDTAASALWNHMTVEDMIALDLGYAPPFAPVWDPILVAARRAAAAVRRAGPLSVGGHSSGQCHDRYRRLFRHGRLGWT